MISRTIKVVIDNRKNGAVDNMAANSALVTTPEEQAIDDQAPAIIYVFLSSNLDCSKIHKKFSKASIGYSLLP